MFFNKKIQTVMPMHLKSAERLELMHIWKAKVWFRSRQKAAAIESQLLPETRTHLWHSGQGLPDHSAFRNLLFDEDAAHIQHAKQCIGLEGNGLTPGGQQLQGMVGRVQVVPAAQVHQQVHKCFAGEKVGGRALISDGEPGTRAGWGGYSVTEAAPMGRPVITASDEPTQKTARITQLHNPVGHPKWQPNSNSFTSVTHCTSGKIKVCQSWGNEICSGP